MSAANSPRTGLRKVRSSVDLTSDKAAALALTPVSRETVDRLDRFVELLLEWQAKTNLVAPSTLPIAIRGSRWAAAAPATVSAATSSKTIAAAQHR